MLKFLNTAFKNVFVQKLSNFNDWIIFQNFKNCKTPLNVANIYF